MELTNLNDVLVHELQDIYSAETQLLTALPKLADHASSEKLTEVFEKHLIQTQGHVNRLEEIANKLDVDLGGVVCKGMQGLIKEGAELLEEDPCAAVDAAIISAAQRVEHYEMAAYGSAIAFADKLGEKEISKILKATLKEEEKADALLSTIAESEVNDDAMDEVGEESDQELEETE